MSYKLRGIELNRIYCIGDIYIRIEYDFPLKPEGRIEKFCVKETDACLGHASDWISYQIQQKDFSDVFQYKCIKEIPEQKIFEGNGSCYRVFTDQSGKNGFACLVCKDGVIQKKWDLYLTEKGKEEIPATNYLTNLLAPEMTLLTYDAVILHASNIRYCGKNILFSGPCGIGKSTQADLWRCHRDALIINGDRALLRKKGQSFWAYGLPFCGSSDICENRSGEIAAIVLLEQGEQNSIRIPGKKEAFLKIYQQITRNTWMPENSMKVMDIISELVEKVPICVLNCRPDFEAVEVLENYLKVGGYF